jgi:hypothetical protein
VYGRKASSITGDRVYQFLFMSVANAADGQDFWLWSGVKTGDALRDARTVYLHQGDVITLSGTAMFERKGLPVSRLTFPQSVTVRLTTLDVSDEMLAPEPSVTALAGRREQCGRSTD